MYEDKLVDICHLNVLCDMIGVIKNQSVNIPNILDNF